MFKNYQETLDFLFQQLPMFQRVGKAAYKADLSITQKLCDAWNHPELAFPSIHIAGTNGKGSVANLLASILMEQGYKVALFTSPHLKDFRERIRIQGQPISKEKVINFVNDTYYGKNSALIQSLKPSFFELTFLIAMQHFADNQVDIAVVETGMGGRLDSTNVVRPVLSIITNIGMDHMAFLGDSLQKIAVEKAGIIKEKVPVVVGKRQSETLEVFEQVVRNKDSKLIFAEDEVSIGENQLNVNGQISFIWKGKKHELQSPFLATYQLENLRTVFFTAQYMSSLGFPISDQSISIGIQKVSSNMGFMGRWQLLQDKPLIICDTGHNVDGIGHVVKQLASMDYENLHLVWGMVNDKELDAVLSLLPKKATYYFCKANIPRAMDAHELREQALSFNLTGNAFPTVNDALSAAKKAASPNDLVFIGGSTFVVAEIL